MNKNPQQATSAAAAAERWRRADLARDAQAAGLHELSKLAAELGMPTTTLRRYARVASEFPEAVRSRVGTLTFSHFEAATGAEGALSLVQRAATERWSVQRVRAECRTVSANQARTAASNDPIDEALRYIESIQGRHRPGISAQELGRDGLIVELARVALIILRAETISSGKPDVA